MINSSLFIGNGINRLTKGYSWFRLLKNLINQLGKSNTIQYQKEKPFTLLFEELVTRAVKFRHMKEIDLKSKIAKSINQIQYNAFHKKLMELNFSHILTTNYDYNLEKSVSDEFKNTSFFKETKYSLFRRRTANNTNIWHIHGEADVKNSIMLGHDQYVRYSSEIRNYLFTGSSTISADYPVISFIKWEPVIYDFENSDRPYSWVDVFLRDDIHVLGFTLDYTEIHLWWLLAYKERQRALENGNFGRTYFYHIEKDYDDKQEEEQVSAKLSLLKSFGVEVRSEKLVQNNYDDVYFNFLHTIKNFA